MNTPRQRRRHSPPRIKDDKAGYFTAGLHSTPHAVRFANIITGFEHLESVMPMLLWRLLGTKRTADAGYVYRALRNPSIKFDILRTLLEKSPSNVDRGSEYDDILTAYAEVRAKRNGYAHGLWYTAENGDVFLSTQDEHGLAFFEAVPVGTDELDSVIAKLSATTRQLMELTAMTPDELRTEYNLPQPAEPKTP